MMDNSFEIHAPEESFNFLPSVRATGRPIPREPRQQQVLGRRLRRCSNLPADLPGPVNPRSPWLPACLVGRPSSDGSEHHRSRSGDHKRRSHGSDRRQDSPRHHSSTYDSGRWEGERARPTSSGGSSSRRQADSTGGLGSSRVSLRATDVQPSGSSSHSYHHHHKSSGDRRSLSSSSSSRASADRKSPPGHHQDGRHESAERFGSSYVSRWEVQLSPAVTQSPERRTITVIPSPTQPEHVEESAAEVDDPARVTGLTEAVDQPAGDSPASDGPADDDPASDGPADDGLAYDGSAGDGTARGPVMVMDDEPDIVDDPEEVADPASQQSWRDGPAIDDDDPAGVAGPAHHQNPAVDGPAVVDGPVAHDTPAGHTPAAWQDSSMLSDVSSLLFPSLPRAINQTTLIDFMSMWTLMQRRMDPGMAVPYAQARPAAQSTVPMAKDDDTPPRRSKTPCT